MTSNSNKRSPSPAKRKGTPQTHSPRVTISQTSGKHRPPVEAESSSSPPKPKQQSNTKSSASKSKVTMQSSGSDRAEAEPAPEPLPRTASTTAIGFVFKLLLDIMTFLVRGGLSTMMFLMDQALSLVLVALSWLPGSVYIGYATRPLAWMFQMMMWVVYTALELIFYLPTKLLVLYLLLLSALYYYLPGVVEPVLYSMYWLSHSFLALVRYFVYHDYNFNHSH